MSVTLKSQINIHRRHVEKVAISHMGRWRCFKVTRVDWAWGPFRIFWRYKTLRFIKLGERNSISCAVWSKGAAWSTGPDRWTAPCSALILFLALIELWNYIRTIFTVLPFFFLKKLLLLFSFMELLYFFFFFFQNQLLKWWSFLTLVKYYYFLTNKLLRTFSFIILSYTFLTFVKYCYF